MEQLWNWVMIATVVILCAVVIWQKRQLLAARVAADDRARLNFLANNKVSLVHDDSIGWVASCDKPKARGLSDTARGAIDDCTNVALGEVLFATEVRNG